LCAQANGSLKEVIAALAFPVVAHAECVGIFGRFRYEQPLATFGAAHKRDVGSAKVHGPSAESELAIRASATFPDLKTWRFKMRLLETIEYNSKSVDPDASD
jgi:hypothetical protein